MEHVMTERPIIFSGPMVRAILEGWKTQTRRVIKPQPVVEFYKSNGTTQGRVTEDVYRNAPGWENDRFHIFRKTPEARGAGPELWAKLNCPYGQVGDRLWVQETFTTATVDSKQAYIYKADPMFDDCDPGFIAWKWTPAIHMPRKASRIELEITAVRVERLQSIGTTDLLSEGFAVLLSEGFAVEDCDGDGWDAFSNVEKRFRALWNSLNECKGYGWDENPWVWVIEFKRIKT